MMLADSATNPTHHNNGSSNNKPYFVPTRKEKSRELAQKRRNTYKSLMNDVADVLPFSKEVVSQIDYNSRLRLAMCFIRMKKLLGEDCEQDCNEEMNCSTDVCNSRKNKHVTKGLIQNLLVESLDGFLLTCQSDGTIIHISESIHRHLGLFQSEHIGFSLYDLVHEDDHYEVKDTIARAEEQAIARLSLDGNVKCSFFCRMKCSKTKLCNSAPKSQGYKLVYIAGQFKLQDNNSYLIAVVHPVSPPSILEVRMEGNMFVTHYTLDMRCTFFDGRLKHLMGFEKEDLVGHVPFQYHHHEDVAANLECSKGLMTRGEGLSGYYRYINKYGMHVWMQSRGIMMYDSRTGKPSYIVCMNYVINKEKGEAELASRQSAAAITSGQPNDVSMATDHARSFDPFPTPRDDNLVVDPFEPEIESVVGTPPPPSNATWPSSDDTLSPIDRGSVISPTDSRNSPDVIITDVLVHEGTGSGRGSNRYSEDLGYSSSISHSSYHGSSSGAVSPQSVLSSVTNDEISCNSVFNGSPQPSLSHSPDPLMSNEKLEQPQLRQSTSVLAKLLTDDFADRKASQSVPQVDHPATLPLSSSAWATRYNTKAGSMNNDDTLSMYATLPTPAMHLSTIMNNMKQQQQQNKRPANATTVPGPVNFQFVSYNVSQQPHTHFLPQSHFCPQPHSHAYSQLPKLPVLTIEDIQLHTSR